MKVDGLDTRHGEAEHTRFPVAAWTRPSMSASIRRTGVDNTNNRVQFTGKIDRLTIKPDRRSSRKANEIKVREAIARAKDYEEAA